jgi:CheY-like chemotaxis protein
MIEHVVSLFEEQAAAHSVGFALDLARTCRASWWATRRACARCWSTWSAMPSSSPTSGAVTCGSSAGRRTKTSSTPRINMIRFSVRGHRHRHRADALPRLFQKFEQADSTTTRRYGGTGLGLAICRQLVELMGGDRRRQHAGQGSTFSFVLPLADGVAPPVVAQVPREPHTHRLRVLCAEDFPTNQIIVRMMLEELGHQVDVARTAQLAVAACARTRYDLILMDGRMPEMDGATATRLIRAGGPLEAPVLDQHLMIVALTANASEEDRNRYLACGMDDFLTKPIDDAQLHFHLSRAIERQLQRGVELPPMPVRAARGAQHAELDAMFGVFTGRRRWPARPRRTPAAAAGDLKGRMRAAFASRPAAPPRGARRGPGGRDHEAPAACCTACAAAPATSKKPSCTSCAANWNWRPTPAARPACRRPAQLLELLLRAFRRSTHSLNRARQDPSCIISLTNRLATMAESTMKVLIVDDDVVSRMVLMHMIDSLPAATTCWKPRMARTPGASSTAAAPGDLFCDLRMPRLSGMELLARVKADPALRTMPFVLVLRRRRRRHDGAGDRPGRRRLHRQALRRDKVRVHLAPLFCCDQAADAGYEPWPRSPPPPCGAWASTASACWST